MSPLASCLLGRQGWTGYGILCIFVMALVAMPAGAQTAHASPQVLGGGFSSPTGVAVDSNGNVFVADHSAGLVKEILAAGGYTTVNTLSSAFNFPFDVALDSNGNLYVTDDSTNTVTKILAAGGYTTTNTLGSGFKLPAGVAVDGSGNVFVADDSNDAVKEILAAGGYTTVNTLGSGFSGPTGVAVDSNGNVYVADFTNHAVKEILAAGGYTTVNTLGSGFSNPIGVALDSNGNVYVADFIGNTVKEIVATGGYTVVNTIASGFNGPQGLTLDGSGNVYVADTSNSAVEKIPSGGMPTTPVAGTSVLQTFNFTFDTGGSIGAPVLLTQGTTGLDFQDAGTGTCTTNGTAHAYSAGDVCTVDVLFKPLYPGLRTGAVELTTTGGAVIATQLLFGTGTGPEVAFPNNNVATPLGYYADPYGMAVDAAGNVYVAGYDPLIGASTSFVIQLTAASGYATANSLGSGFNQPEGMVVDGAGNVYVADLGNNAVKEIVAASGYSTVQTVGSGISGPYGLAMDAANNLFVTEFYSGDVKELVAGSGYSTVLTLATGFVNPTGIGVDANENLFVSELSNSDVKEMLAAGGYTTITAVGSGFSAPYGIKLDAAGNVYVADSNYNGVQEILAAGGYKTVKSLGSGLGGPYDVAVDSLGNLFVADATGLVRRMDLHDAPSLAFATTNIGSTSSDSPQTMTMANIGNANLSVVVPASGKNPSIGSDYSLSGGAGTCPVVAAGESAGTVAPGVDCNLVFSFKPHNGGVLNEAWTLTDNNLNAGGPAYATHTISLSGTSMEATAVAVSAYPSPAAVGELVTITATLTDATIPGGVSAGGVTFTDKFGSTVTNLNGGTAVTLVGSKAVLQTTLSGVGAHTITANYSGPTGFVSSNNSVALTLAATASGAHLTSPAAGSTLSGSATFNWTGGVGVTEYVLWVGSSRYAHDIANVVLTSTATSTTVNSLPTNGESIYVTLNSLAGVTWVQSSSTYLASGHGTAAAISSPVNKATLSGASATFNWSGGSGISEYVLWVGSTANSHDLGNVVLPGTATSANVTTLPTNGESVYVTLNSLNGSTWLKNSYSYIASGHGTAAAMTSPTNHSTFTGASATFNWSGGVGIDEYLLWIGTTPGAHNIANVVLPATASATTVTTLPTNGENVYVTLNSLNGATWLANSSSYIASGHGTAAAIYAPANKSTLTSTNVSFRWSGGVGISQYVLWVGTTAGAHDLANVTLPGTASSANVSGLPTNGSTIYVTLNSLNGATYLKNSYTFTAQ